MAMPPVLSRRTLGKSTQNVHRLEGMAIARTPVEHLSIRRASPPRLRAMPEIYICLDRADDTVFDHAIKIRWFSSPAEAPMPRAA